MEQRDSTGDMRNAQRGEPATGVLRQALGMDAGLDRTGHGFRLALAAYNLTDAEAPSLTGARRLRTNPGLRPSASDRHRKFPIPRRFGKHLPFFSILLEADRRAAPL